MHCHTLSGCSYAKMSTVTDLAECMCVCVCVRKCLYVPPLGNE